MELTTISAKEGDLLGRKLMLIEARLNAIEAQLEVFEECRKKMCGESEPETPTEPEVPTEPTEPEVPTEPTEPEEPTEITTTVHFCDTTNTTYVKDGGFESLESFLDFAAQSVTDGTVVPESRYMVASWWVDEAHTKWVYDYDFETSQPTDIWAKWEDAREINLTSFTEGLYVLWPEEGIYTSSYLRTYAQSTRLYEVVNGETKQGDIIWSRRTSLLTSTGSLLKHLIDAPSLLVAGIVYEIVYELYKRDDMGRPITYMTRWYVSSDELIHARDNDIHYVIAHPSVEDIPDYSPEQEEPEVPTLQVKEILTDRVIHITAVGEFDRVIDITAAGEFDRTIDIRATATTEREI